MVNKRLIVKKLKEYEQMVRVAKATAHAQAKLKDEITKMVMESDEAKSLADGIKLEGYGVRLVSPIQSKFNKKKFVELGGNIDLYTQAHDPTPTKSYVKITVPGEVVYEEVVE